MTPGAPSDGQVVPGFTAAITGTVNALALNGNALYAGGSFKSVKSFGGTKDHAIARLNATTGAVDPAFKFTLGGTVSGTLQVERMSLTPTAPRWPSPAPSRPSTASPPPGSRSSRPAAAWAGRRTGQLVRSHFCR